MNLRVFVLKEEIKRLNKALYKDRKELKSIQKQCIHRFPGFNKKKKTKKVFIAVCVECGYSKMVSEHAAIIQK